MFAISAPRFSARQTPPVAVTNATVAAGEVEIPSRRLLVEGPQTRQTLHLRQWYVPGKTPADLPDQAPVVLMVHSLSGRSGWMAPLVANLMARRNHVEGQADMLFYGLDLAQVGQNPYQEGDIGRSGDLVDEVRDSVEYLAKRHNRPVVLVGLSLGGLLVTHVAAKPPKSLAGVVALSPGYMINQERFLNKQSVKAGIKNFTLGKLGRVAGKDFSSGIPFDFVDGLPQTPEASKTAKPPKTPMQRRIVREKGRDDKVNGLTVASYARIMRLMMDLAYRKARQITLPYQLILSKTDNVVDVGWAQEKVYPKIRSQEKRLIMFEDAEHDFNTDPVIGDVAQAVNAFLDARFDR